MTKNKSKGVNVSHISKYKEEIENLKQENQALKDLLDVSGIMLSHATSKKVSQSFEIIDLKDKIINYKLDIALLVIGIIFISIIAIIK